MKKAARGGEQRGRRVDETKALIERLGESQAWEEADFHAVLVMLAPLCIGVRDPEGVSRFTGVPLPLVIEFQRRLADNGVLPPGAWFPKDGSIRRTASSCSCWM